MMRRNYIWHALMDATERAEVGQAAFDVLLRQHLARGGGLDSGLAVPIANAVRDGVITRRPGLPRVSVPARLQAMRFSESILASSRPTTRRHQLGSLSRFPEPVDMPAGAETPAVARVTTSFGWWHRSSLQGWANATAGQ